MKNLIRFIIYLPPKLSYSFCLERENAFKMKFLIGICCIFWSLYKCVGSETAARDQGSTFNKTLQYNDGQKGIVTLTTTDRCLLDATVEYVGKVPKNADLSKPKNVQAWCTIVKRHSDCIWEYGVEYDKESEKVLNASLLDTETWHEHHQKCPWLYCGCIDKVVEKYVNKVTSIAATDSNKQQEIKDEGCGLIRRMRNCLINTANCGRDFSKPSFKIVELWARNIRFLGGKYDRESVGTMYDEYCRRQKGAAVPERYVWIPLKTKCINCTFKEHEEILSQHPQKLNDNESLWNAKDIALVTVLSGVVVGLLLFLLYISCQIIRYKTRRQRYARIGEGSLATQCMTYSSMTG